jgi:GcrA cell cycle regulator
MENHEAIAAEQSFQPRTALTSPMWRGPSQWTDESLEGLKGLWSGDTPASVIARILNDEFGTSFTRNAIIGKARREGLPAKVVRCYSINDRIERRRLSRRKYAAQVAARPVVIPFPEQPAEPVVPLGKKLMQLKADDCRYPYGDGPFTFCGHRKLSTGPYCAAHQAITHSQSTVYPRGVGIGDGRKRPGF